MNVNLFSASEAAGLLARRGLRPKKRLGQNFLIDRNVLRKILDAAEVDRKSSVLEIGPGLGTVTRELARLADRIVAVEADRDLIPILNETLGGLENVEVVNADFLKLNLPEFLRDHFGRRRCTVVANLPYYITSPLIGKLLESKSQIDRMVLMVQQEVAGRLAAGPGSSDYGAFTVFVEYHCQIRVVARVRHTVFYPPPDVDSAIVRLDVRESPVMIVQDEALFFDIVRSAFGQRRKTLLGSLSGSPRLGWTRETAQAVLRKAGIDPVRRGETLSLSEFAAIANSAGSEL